MESKIERRECKVLQGGTKRVGTPFETKPLAGRIVVTDDAGNFVLVPSDGDLSFSDFSKKVRLELRAMRARSEMRMSERRQ